MTGPVSWIRRRRAGRSAPIEQTMVTTSLDAERPGWAVVTVAGHFRDRSSVELLGHALLDALLDGSTIVAIDASRARTLSPSACRTFVAAAELFAGFDGTVIVTGLGQHDSTSIRLLDLHRRVEVLVGQP